nr:hypothetical protein [Tanacetum cinerariifolium]
MSTQQDLYAAGSESRLPMLNKENYVPWSSRLLRYAKSRPNGKLIHNSILNCLYVRRMILEPGDANRKINVTETFHLQTDDKLSDKELKQIEADNQAIQTSLLGLPEDIYAAIAQPGMNMGQDRQMQMIEGNGGNQFMQYVGQNTGNLAGYNDVIGNQVIQNAVQNLRVQNTDQLRYMKIVMIMIFNMFIQEEQYTELLEPIPESYQVPHNDNVVISDDTSVEQ